MDLKSENERLNRIIESVRLSGGFVTDPDLVAANKALKERVWQLELLLNAAQQQE